MRIADIMTERTQPKEDDLAIDAEKGKLAKKHEAKRRTDHVAKRNPSMIDDRDTKGAKHKKNTLKAELNEKKKFLMLMTTLPSIKRKQSLLQSMRIIVRTPTMTLVRTIILKMSDPKKKNCVLSES